MINDTFLLIGIGVHYKTYDNFLANFTVTQALISNRIYPEMSSLTIKLMIRTNTCYINILILHCFTHFNV